MNKCFKSLTLTLSWVVPLVMYSGTCASAKDDRLSPDNMAGMVSDISNLAAANTMFLLSLHDRQGETQFTDALNGKSEVTSLWLRQAGGHNNWRDASGVLKTQGNRYITQVGGDIARWSRNGQDRWHVGFMGGYGNMHSHTDSNGQGKSSRGSLEGYSVGTYLTGYANDETHSGAWLDGWLMYIWFDNEVKGTSLSTESYKSHGISASLEGGYIWKIGETIGSKGSRNQWFIQPHAQVVWMGVRADEWVAENGTHVKGEGDGNLMTRLGMRLWLKGHHVRDDKKNREFQPFIELNWIHHTRDFGTQVNEDSLYQNGTRNIGEMVVGLEGQINKRLHTWGNIGVQVGDNSYNDTSAVLGIKYLF